MRTTDPVEQPVGAITRSRFKAGAALSASSSSASTNPETRPDSVTEEDTTTAETNLSRPPRQTKQARKTRTNTKAHPSISTEDASWRASSDPRTYHFFYGHTPSPSNPEHLCVLSQWYPQPFSDGTHTFATAEHYMMWRKAVLFNDVDTASQILSEENPWPGVVKALGRQVRDFDQETWDREADAIVQRGNYFKFQDERLWGFLDATQDKVLVEAAPRDRIWGIGFGRARAMAERERWGRNRLGLALMRVREQIRTERETALRAEWDSERAAAETMT